MRVVSHGLFDGYQQILAEEIIRAGKFELERVEAPADLVMQLTGSIAFAVTSLIVGRSPIATQREAARMKRTLVPLLLFVCIAAGAQPQISEATTEQLAEYKTKTAAGCLADAAEEQLDNKRARASAVARQSMSGRQCLQQSCSLLITTGYSTLVEKS